MKKVIRSSVKLMKISIQLSQQADAMRPIASDSDFIDLFENENFSFKNDLQVIDFDRVRPILIKQYTK
ncbi:hypothetical protein SS50377_24866 [Spironucleus salmonicida]|uniref:Uncharacterized protein n=1 Tax=Spironucleus salmonicida TaxID=348837 RepID=V6LZE8_9EUKA|nr:hypothetical protein SS50377_24866 [Spironucleus salmonicida]|eukprot:EST49126.1 Hypothetical protein SS50377_10612 [Spironucleus salmonicida]